MTAEVAILNRQAVAFAADSAVTLIGSAGTKIFTSANKIFGLSGSHPIGVMIYGAADVMGIPWETLIKLYREQLGSRSFSTLDEYANDFFEFAQTAMSRLVPDEVELGLVTAMVGGYVQAVRREIDEAVEQVIETDGTISSDVVDKIVEDRVESAYTDVMAGAPCSNVPAGFMIKVRRLYGPLVGEAIQEVLKEHKLTPRLNRRLHTLLLNLFARVPSGYEPPQVAGVVVAGFGDTQIFPSLREWLVEGLVAGYLQRHEQRKVDISTAGTAASIVPFAQGEMVYRFMEGVDPDYQVFIETMITEMVQGYPATLLGATKGISKKTQADLLKRASDLGPQVQTWIQDRLKAMRYEQFARPVSRLVNSLPKDELASMAEALVNLTSFKRRMSWDAETVGGPIDVAVISKGDGLVWIKRKHYFDPELNPAYFANRYGGST